MFNIFKLLGYRFSLGFADNVAITAGSGTTIAADEVADGTLGTVKVQYVKIMDGTLDGTTKAAVGSGGLKVDLSGTGANSTAVKVDGSAVTQPVSAASLPLPTGASSIGDGRKVCSTAGTASQFSSQACKYVLITGLENNTDIVVIGGASVVAAASGGGTTRTGIPISPLQQVRLEISNMNLLYIDAVVSGEGVSFAYFN